MKTAVAKREEMIVLDTVRDSSEPREPFDPIEFWESQRILPIPEPNPKQQLTCPHCQGTFELPDS
jgi:hypothetical protein